METKTLTPKRGPGAPRKYTDPDRRNIIGEREMLEAIAALGNGNLSAGVAELYRRNLAANGKTARPKAKPNGNGRRGGA